MSIPALITFNGVTVTDQGRTYSEIRDERAVKVELASGQNRKYVKAEKKSFSISWDWLPNSSTSTYDGGAARDTIRGLAYSGATITIQIFNVGGSATSSESYTCFVESYSEDILRRDTNLIFYKVKIDLKER